MPVRLTSPTVGGRLTTRRGETRQNLLDAALDVFAEFGFGRATVERVCDRAGYSRGAFYSNFDSMDELFLAMWEQRFHWLLDGLREAMRAPLPQSRPGDFPVQGVARVISAMPVDDKWYRVNAEFAAHALREPSLRRVLAGRAPAILETIMPAVERALAYSGYRIIDRTALGHALVAVHDGTVMQCVIEPRSRKVKQRRIDLFTAVVRAHTAPMEAL